MQSANEMETSENKPPTFRGFEERLRNGHLKKELSPTDMKVMLRKGGMFRIHKDLFVMASPEFENLVKLEQARARCDPEHTIKLHLDKETFRVIYKFLYLDDIDHVESVQITRLDLALSVLEACVQFKIDRLEPQIIGKVVSLMTPDNAVKVLEVARVLVQISPIYMELEAKTLSVIYKNADASLMSDNFCSLGLHDATRILSSDLLEISNERHVFDAVLRWAEAKAKICRNYRKSLQYYFDQLKYCIRFPTMSPEDLARISDLERLLGSACLLELFRFVCLPPQLGQLTSPFETKPRRVVAHANRVTVETQTEEHYSTITENTQQQRSATTLCPPPAAPVPQASPCHKKPRISRVGTDAVTTFSTSLNTTIETSIRRQSIQAEEDDDDLFVVCHKRENLAFTSFEDMSRRYLRRDKKDSFGSMTFNNITFDRPYNTPVYKSCNALIMNARFKFIEGGNRERKRATNFTDFLAHFDITRFIFFDTKGNRSLECEHICSLGLNILLKFNGITFLKVRHQKLEDHEAEVFSRDGSKPRDELTLNYIRDSRRILTNETFYPEKLAMSNCEFSTKDLKDRTGRLKILILYHCWGDFTMKDILTAFPALKQLTCWKVIPSFWHKSGSITTHMIFDYQTLTDTTKQTLENVVLYQTQLKLPTRGTQTSCNITSLNLEYCYILQSGRDFHYLSDIFHTLFPKLEQLVIVERYGKAEKDGNMANSDVINGALKIESLEYLHVVGMKWTEGECVNPALVYEGDVKLQSFLSELGLPDKPKNFILKRNKREQSVLWEGTFLKDLNEEPENVDGGAWSQRDEEEYRWYSLNNFYDTTEIYEDYFLQDVDNFPRPILWV